VYILKEGELIKETPLEIERKRIWPIVNPKISKEHHLWKQKTLKKTKIYAETIRPG